jgi:hypothetical protein
MHPNLLLQTVCHHTYALTRKGPLMSTWRALSSMAEGMVEIVEGRTNPWCLASGHKWHWETDAVACSRSRCRHTNGVATQAVLAEFGSPEGQVFIADELKRRAA